MNRTVTLVLALLLVPAFAAAVESQRADVLASTSQAMDESVKAALEAARAEQAPAEEPGDSWVVNTLLYGGAVDYRKATAKKSAAYGGVYGYFGIDPVNLVELAYDQLAIDFSAGGTRRQTELTLVYTNFSDPGWKLRVGGHTADTDRTLSADGQMGLLGLYRYEPGKWEAGFELYRSSYTESAPHVTAWQVSPRVGLAVGDPGGGLLWNELTAHAIFFDSDPGVGSKELFSVEEKLTLTAGRWSGTLSAWVGDQAYAVRDSGFVMFNLAEKHEGGFGLQVRHQLREQWSLAARAGRELFTELGRSDRSKADSLTVTLGRTF